MRRSLRARCICEDEVATQKDALWLHNCVEAEQNVWIKQIKPKVKSHFMNVPLSFQGVFSQANLSFITTSEAMYFKPSTSSHCSGHILITLLKGTSAAYLQPADSAPTFSRLLYYPLNKREPKWSVALCNESFSRVMKLVWNKESGSNIKLCPITIITDLFYWLRWGT